jgi:tetratricopeptide (TPR) repeat protein
MKKSGVMPHFTTFLKPVLLCGLLAGCGRSTPVTPTVTPQQRPNSVSQELAKATTDQERFYALNNAAKQSFVLGQTEEARKYASNLLALLPKFPDDWNYGNAVQDANLVLGRIAVQEGRIEDAKRHLQEAGKSPGSPQMNSFGPNMSLAKDLVEKGERDVVVEYFELCRKFWRMDRGRLDQWSQEVKSGKVPDFGANLVY